MSKYDFQIKIKSKEDYARNWQKLISNNILRIIFGAAMGAGLGYLYWTFIGCNSGTCPLTSTPLKTIAIFSIMGMVWFYKK